MELVHHDQKKLIKKNYFSDVACTRISTEPSKEGGIKT